MAIVLKNRRLLKLINGRVKSGGYASVEHVLTAALACLEQQERFGDFEPGEMDELCRVGIEELKRGDGLDGEQVLRELDALRDAALKKRKRRR